MEQQNNKTEHTYLKQGLDLLYKGIIDDALVCFQQAQEINPENIEPHILMANLYCIKQDWALAKQAILLALQLEP